MSDEKTVWTQEEFAREVHPVKQMFRVYHVDGRGPAGHALLVAAAVDANGKHYYLGEPQWHSAPGVSAVPELATIPMEHVQQLLDSLWAMGLRPTEDPVLKKMERIENAVEFLAAMVDDSESAGVLHGVRDRLEED